MATDNLKFEFQRRWQQLGQLLFGSSMTADQQTAITMLEQNMQDLEDHWPGGSSGALPRAGFVQREGDGASTLSPGDTATYSDIGPFIEDVILYIVYTVVMIIDLPSTGQRVHAFTEITSTQPSAPSIGFEFDIDGSAEPTVSGVGVIPIPAGYIGTIQFSLDSDSTADGGVQINYQASYVEVRAFDE